MTIITKKCVEDDYYKEQILEDFLSVMREEIKLHGWDSSTLLPRAEEIMNLTVQIFEIAYSSVIPRSYNINYGLSKDEITFESISAHTRLMTVLILKALDFVYGPDVDEYPGGYRLKDIIKMLNRHDLPENIIGDQPDNGNRDDSGLAKIERKYYKEYGALSLKATKDYEERTQKLQKEFEEKSSTMGRFTYSGDKTSAIIVTLLLDAIGYPPKMKEDSPYASDIDKHNMSICDVKDEDGYYASEMWTISYLKTRQMDAYDDTGFFTAIIVFATLLVNHRWYDWRDKDYLATLILRD